MFGCLEVDFNVGLANGEVLGTLGLSMFTPRIPVPERLTNSETEESLEFSDFLLGELDHERTGILLAGLGVSVFRDE